MSCPFLFRKMMPKDSVQVSVLRFMLFYVISTIILPQFVDF